MSKQRKLAYFALIIAALIWGIATVVIKYTLGFISPISFLFYRFLIASLVVIIPLIRRIKKIKPKTNDWFWYIFLGFLCAPLNLYLLFIGINKTTAIDASLISITAPIFVAIGGALFLREQVTKKEKLGLAIAIFGTLVTIIQPLFESKTTFLANIEGNFLVLLGTLVWVVFTLMTKKRKNLDPFILSSSSFVVGLISITLLALFKNNLPSFQFSVFSFQLNAVYGILFMAIFSSAIAYYAHIYGLSKIEASEAEVFTYLQPIFAVPIAAVFLGETITAPFVLGAVFTTIGIIASSFRAKSRKH